MVNLYNIPLDVLLIIAEDLDYHDLVALSLTCRYLRSTIPQDVIEKRRDEEALLVLEDEFWDSRSTGLTLLTRASEWKPLCETCKLKLWRQPPSHMRCYTCSKLRPRTKSWKTQTCGDWRLGGEKAGTMICSPCAIRTKTATSGDRQEMSDRGLIEYCKRCERKRLSIDRFWLKFHDSSLQYGARGQLSLTGKQAERYNARMHRMRHVSTLWSCEWKPRWPAHVKGSLYLG
jgi:hypothetical protein